MAQNRPVVKLKNGSSQNVTVVNTATPFVSGFKASSDMTATAISGTSFSRGIEGYSIGGNSTNPSYITSFVGTNTNLTGDGVAGHIDSIIFSGCTMQFDFAVPLNAFDRLLITDTEYNEQVTIQAYVKNGANYDAVNLLGWIHEAFSGASTSAPTADWSTWNATTGKLTGNGQFIPEPLDVFTPNQNIDRVVITSASTTGKQAYQFMALPEPACGFAVIAAAMCMLRSRSNPRRRGSL